MKTYSSPLARQIIRSVVVIAVGAVLMTTAASYLLYGILVRLDLDNLLPLEDKWLPSGIEWFIIGIQSTLAAIVAALVAQRLAHRIVAPIVSVAQSARQMAGGDLTARAEHGEASLSELSILVNDFNLLGKRLELASQGVTQWNATIAHELRTPVTILRGRIQGLADGVFKPEPQLLRSLEVQIVSLARLIDDLRTVTLFDGGRLSVDLQPTDLAEIVQSTVQFMRADLEQRSFDLATEIEPVVCRADGARLRQVVIALLENAQRYATPGRIVVSLKQELHKIHLSICDSGPGLPPNFEEHAFDPWERYIKDGGKLGSGLGLSVVRAIAEIHGGTASYRKIDGGSCFDIVFPAH